MNKTRRLGRLFGNDGKCLVVAMDHAGFMDKPLRGLEQPAELIRSVVQAGADSVLITRGSAERYADAIGRAGLWLSVDTDLSWLERIAETALALSEDGVKCIVYPSWDEKPNSLAQLAALTADCRRWNIPVMAEVIPGGFLASAEMRTAEKIAAGARVAFEAGADVIKTFYTGDANLFRAVVEYCPAPIVVLGGERAANDRELLNGVRDALGAGAAGVAIGRNIWQHPQPQKITAALAALIHRGVSVEDALSLNGLNT